MNESDYLFVYGILKRGFELDLSSKAEFIGEACLLGAKLYRISNGVGLRFTDNLLEDEVYGEVFKIPQGLWKWLDFIEANGFAYTRKIGDVHLLRVLSDDLDRAEELLLEPIKAYVYEHTFPGMHYDRPIDNGRFENAPLRIQL